MVAHTCFHCRRDSKGLVYPGEIVVDEMEGHLIHYRPSTPLPSELRGSARGFNPGEDFLLDFARNLLVLPLRHKEPAHGRPRRSIIIQKRWPSDNAAKHLCRLCC